MNLSVGEKLKKRRIELHLTQNDVVENVITRNMLSQIESGKAMPSNKTLEYLSKKLDLPLLYLLNDDVSLDTMHILENQPEMISAYKEGSYKKCISIFEEEYTDTKDDLIIYLAINAYYNLLESAGKAGQIHHTAHYIDQIKFWSKKTCLETSHILAKTELYYALTKTPIKPTYSFNEGLYKEYCYDTTNEELYHYLIEDESYPFKNKEYIEHMKIKKMMKEYHYMEAIESLNALIDNRFREKYSVLLIYRLYSDLEVCYIERKDFENAYKITKRKNTLAESFSV